MKALWGRSTAACAAIALAAMLAAAPAHAALDNWTGLTGLNAANGAQWIRQYAQDPLTQAVYAATENTGVFRSVDGGLHWTDFSSGLDAAPGGRTVRALYISGSTVYAGTDAGLFTSTGGGWTPIAQGPEADPAHPTKLNASVQAVLSGAPGQILAGVFNGGVYKSTDGGATWTPPAPGNGMPAGNTVWSLASLAPNVIFAATSYGVYRSVDFGSTWMPANDGMTGVTLRIYADATSPNIYYTGTGDAGVFRSLNAGVTWSQIDGPSGHALGDVSARALQQFSVAGTTRLYAGTGNGVYAGTTGNGPSPGPVTWRHISNTGLTDQTGTNTIFWSLFRAGGSSPLLVGGTQSNGGYALQLKPPSNTVLPVTSGALQVGQLQTATSGTWNGTQDIDYTYQWQHCSSNVGGCSNIDDATEPTYPLAPADKTKWFRVAVTATNDFPQPNGVTVFSAIRGAVGPNLGDLPGFAQSSAASAPSDLGPGDPSLPQSGDTLKAGGWIISGATSFTFKWLRCDGNGNGCDPIPGAKAQTYKLTDDDVGHRLRVVVTGANADGSTTVAPGGATNTIFPEAATNVTAPTVVGPPYVGSSVVGNVGVWKYPGTTYKHYWQVCEADGSDCETRIDQTGSTYTPTADDLGHTLRFDVIADSNEDNHYPGPTEVFSMPSGVIVNAPVADGGGGGGGDDNGGGGGSSTPPVIPIFTIAPPKMSATKLSSGKVKSGKTVKLSYRLSEAATLSVVLKRELKGRKAKGKKCKAGARKGTKCTVAKTVKTFTFKGRAGAGSATIPTKIGKHRLPRGTYTLTVTPIDATKHKGKATTVKLKVT